MEEMTLSAAAVVALCNLCRHAHSTTPSSAPTILPANLQIPHCNQMEEMKWSAVAALCNLCRHAHSTTPSSGLTSPPANL